MRRDPRGPSGLLYYGKDFVLQLMGFWTSLANQVNFLPTETQKKRVVTSQNCLHEPRRFPLVVPLQTAVNTDINWLERSGENFCGFPCICSPKTFILRDFITVALEIRDTGQRR